MSDNNNFAIGVNPGQLDIGMAVSYVDFNGNQQKISIQDQLITEFSTLLNGDLLTTDSIVNALSKLRNVSSLAYTTLTTGTSTSVTAYQQAIFITSPVILTFPNANATGVRPGVPYIVYSAPSLVSSSQFSVPSGQTLNNVLNGTFSTGALLAGWTKFFMTSDGTKWYAA